MVDEKVEGAGIGHRYIGVDPGASGGIALLRTDGQGSVVVTSAWKIPETELDLLDLFMSLRVGPVPVSAVIERVQPAPWLDRTAPVVPGEKPFFGRGSIASFKLGMSYGYLRCCLHAAKIPFEEVTPKSWQTAMSCRTKGHKAVTKAKAQQLYPDMKITHAIADALLIATYHMRKTLGTL